MKETFSQKSVNRYGNGRSNVPITIYLTPRDAQHLIQLSNENETKPHVYLSEIISNYLYNKRHPNIEPNYYQRAQTETAIVSCQQDV